MLFWLIAAVLTLGASAAILWPFLRAQPHAPADPAAHDLEVYRDQLREIERDAENGLVGPSEAKEARAEVGRRILRAAAVTADPASISADRLGKMTMTVAVLIVPLLGWGAYAVLGSPNLPDQRLASRLAKDPAESSPEELVVRAEAHLRANPEDERGWDVLAPIYLRLDRHEEAAIAFRNAIRLNGPSVAREAGLGEALTAAAGGVVNAEAQSAFERALAIEPLDARSRFFLALGYAQEGRVGEAQSLWRQMTADLPRNSPWRGAAEQALARPGGDETDEASAGQGPSEEEKAASMEMSSEDRLVMIEGMVAQLDARLRENPADPQGWQRLVQSYQVLGRTADAQQALARGIEGLGASTPAAEELVHFAAALGISEAKQP